MSEVFCVDQVEFGQREIAFRLIHQKKTMAYINQRLRDLGADILFQEEFEELSTIERKARYLRNFASVKEELNQEMPLWHPNPIPLEGDFLE